MLRRHINFALPQTDTPVGANSFARKPPLPGLAGLVRMNPDLPLVSARLACKGGHMQAGTSVGANSFAHKPPLPGLAGLVRINSNLQLGKPAQEQVFCKRACPRQGVRVFSGTSFFAQKFSARALWWMRIHSRTPPLPGLAGLVRMNPDPPLARARLACKGGHMQAGTSVGANSFAHKPPLPGLAGLVRINSNLQLAKPGHRAEDHRIKIKIKEASRPGRVFSLMVLCGSSRQATISRHKIDIKGRIVFT